MLVFCRIEHTEIDLNFSFVYIDLREGENEK